MWTRLRNGFTAAGSYFRTRQGAAKIRPGYGARSARPPYRGVMDTRILEALPVLRRPLVQDALLGAGVAVLSVVSLWTPPALVDFDFRDPDVLGVVLCLLGAGAVVLRSLHPVTAWAVALMASMVVVQLGYSQTLGGLPTLLTLYTVTVRTPFWTSLVAGLATIVGISVVLVTGPVQPSFGDWIANALVLALGWTFGRSIRHRRARAVTAADRDRALVSAERAEDRSAELRRQAAVAQELQDLVAHRLTELTVQIAGARRVLLQDPALAERTLGEAEEAGRSAMRELRHQFEVLRSSVASADRRPMPGLDDLADLAAGLRKRGLPVRLDVQAAPTEVPPGVALTAYRVVEQALTDLPQGAGSGSACVTVTATTTELTVRVTVVGAVQGSGDAGGARTPGRMRPLQERVRLYGGRLTLDPAPDGSVVEAVLPLDRAGAR